MADGADFQSGNRIRFTADQSTDDDNGSGGIGFSAPDFNRTPSGGSGGSDGGDDFDPGIHIARDKRNADGSYRRKRAKRGSGARNTANSGTGRAKGRVLQASVDSLGFTITMLSAAIAGASKSPELNVTVDEGNTVAGALVHWMDQFDIAPSPKVEATIGLLIILGGTYGPKINAANRRKRLEKLEPEAPSENEIYGAPEVAL